MGGIKLVIFAVLCSADSLSCIEAPTSQYAFSTPDRCEQQLRRSLSSLRNMHPVYRTPMGRCRYLLIEEEARPVAEWAEPSKRLEQAFGLVDQADMDGETSNRVRIAAQKSDRLATDACEANQLGLSHKCTAGGDHSGSQPPPTVTVEYANGDNGSILVRLPLEQMATRR